MKDIKRRLTKLRVGLRLNTKFTMTNSAASSFLRWRGRNMEPVSPSATDNNDDYDNHEINSTSIPSTELLRQRLYPDLNESAPSQQPDVPEHDDDTRHFFSPEDGFYETRQAAREARNTNNRLRREDGVDHAPDAFTEAAQNDYNSEVERIMQESRQLQADRILASRQQQRLNFSPEQQNVRHNRQNRDPFPVEVDLVGVEASTTLILLGIALLFVSRWYALLYLVVISYLLYRLRRSVYEQAQARAAAQQRMHLHVPEIFTELQQMFKLLFEGILLLILFPVAIVGFIARIGQVFSNNRSTAYARGPTAGHSQDIKFLLQLMFFPLFIPYWLSQFRSSLARPSPRGQYGQRGDPRGGGFTGLFAGLTGLFTLFSCFGGFLRFLGGNRNRRR